VSYAPDRSLVELRPLSHDDVDDILSWVNDPAIVGNLATFSGKPLTRADEEAWVDGVTASDTDRVFSVVAADDGRYLGQVGLHQIFWRSRVGRLSAIIARREEMGRGFGTAALARLLDVAFEQEKLHKVWLMVFHHNERSRRTYERLGFVTEGRLREEYFHEGGWHDMIRMSLLAREWTRS
jgi:RimJ/RimL family protein N-acetyltransferase